MFPFHGADATEQTRGRFRIVCARPMWPYITGPIKIERILVRLDVGRVPRWRDDSWRGTDGWSGQLAGEKLCSTMAERPIGVTIFSD